MGMREIIKSNRIRIINSQKVIYLLKNGKTNKNEKEKKNQKNKARCL